MSTVAYDLIKRKMTEQVEQQKKMAALQEAKELMEETAPSMNKNKKENTNGRTNNTKRKSAKSSR